MKTTGNRYELRLPDFRHKDSQVSLINHRISCVKEASKYGSGGSIGELLMIHRILAVREERVIFVIGFVRVKPPTLLSERPNFRRSRIEWGFLLMPTETSSQDEQDNVYLILIVIARNAGGTSALSDFQLTVELPDGRPPFTIPYLPEIPEKFTIKPRRKRQAGFVFYGSDSLARRTSQQPVSKTLPVKGLVFFRVSQVTPQELEGAPLHLRFRDVASITYQLDYRFLLRPPEGDVFRGLKSHIV